MKQDSTGQELMALERKFWDAVKNGDALAATSLSDDLCVVVGPQGVGEVDRDALAKMMENPTCTLKEFAFDDVHIHRVTDDVMVVAYKVKEDLDVEGQAIDLEAFESSVWVRREGHWLCVVHTESLAGDPYGRH